MSSSDDLLKRRLMAAILGFNIAVMLIMGGFMLFTEEGAGWGAICIAVFVGLIAAGAGFLGAMMTES